MGWSEYINFLFDEDFNYRNKLSNYKIKRTKKTEKKETLETNTSNIINNNNFNNEKKNIKLYWFKWSENSCRFDCFSLALSLIYYKYIKIKNSNSKEILNLIDFVENIIDLSNKEKKLGIWNFFNNNIIKNYLNLGNYINKYKKIDVIAGLYNNLKKIQIFVFLIQ